ncbi:hypothetical protein [Micromonospora sp. DT227]|uniref:hypothetical protein n=1 Tax=Micromonospora sp. DT227 TaxID=3393433 RepID=UPI003CED2486
MGRTFGMDIVVNDVPVRDLVLTWDLIPTVRSRRRGEPLRVESPADGWGVDVPGVLGLIEAIERTGGGIGQLREVLLGSIDKLVPHGCCPDCEEALPSYKQALAAYAEAAERMVERQASVTPETHPFVVTRSSAIHLWNCPSSPSEDLVHPGDTLAEWTHGKVIDGFLVPVRSYDWEPTNEVRRMTGEELADWIRSVRGPQGGLNYRRCKRCQPALPVAYTSSAGDVYLND